MDNDTVTTEHEIGRITYLVVSYPCDKATETIKTKVEQLILKDVSIDSTNGESV